MESFRACPGCGGPGRRANGRGGDVERNEILWFDGDDEEIEDDLDDDEDLDEDCTRRIDA